MSNEPYSICGVSFEDAEEACAVVGIAREELPAIRETLVSRYGVTDREDMQMYLKEERDTYRAKHHLHASDATPALHMPKAAPKKRGRPAKKLSVFAVEATKKPAVINADGLDPVPSKLKKKVTFTLDAVDEVRAKDLRVVAGPAEKVEIEKVEPYGFVTAPYEAQIVPDVITVAKEERAPIVVAPKALDSGFFGYQKEDVLRALGFNKKFINRALDSFDEKTMEIVIAAELGTLNRERLMSAVSKYVTAFKRVNAYKAHLVRKPGYKARMKVRQALMREDARIVKTLSAIESTSNE